MKKKLYNSPVAEFVEILLPPCMSETATVPFGGDDEDDDEPIDGDNANENIGGSWENIWNMQ